MKSLNEFLSEAASKDPKVGKKFDLYGQTGFYHGTELNPSGGIRTTLFPAFSGVTLVECEGKSCVFENEAGKKVTLVKLKDGSFAHPRDEDIARTIVDSDYQEDHDDYDGTTILNYVARPHDPKRQAIDPASIFVKSGKYDAFIAIEHGHILTDDPFFIGATSIGEDGALTFKLDGSSVNRAGTDEITLEPVDDGRFLFPRRDYFGSADSASEWLAVFDHGKIKV